MMSDSDSMPSGASGKGAPGPGPRRRSRGGRGRGRGRRSPRPATEAQGPAKPGDVVPEESADLAPAPADTEGTSAQGEVAGGDDEQFFATPPEMEVPDQLLEHRAQVRAEPAPAPRREERPPPRPARVFQPAQPATIRLAIDEVMEIISSLRDSLDKLDEMLELLEEAERQKTADEREIESLRQSLRRFQRPPEELQRQRPQHPQGGRRDDPRQHRDERGRNQGHRDQRPLRDNRDAQRSARPQPIGAGTNATDPVDTAGSSESAGSGSPPSAASENGPDAGSPS